MKKLIVFFLIYSFCTNTMKKDLATIAVNSPKKEEPFRHYYIPTEKISEWYNSSDQTKKKIYDITTLDAREGLFDYKEWFTILHERTPTIEESQYHHSKYLVSTHYLLHSLKKLFNDKESLVLHAKESRINWLIDMVKKKEDKEIIKQLILKYID